MCTHGRDQGSGLGYMDSQQAPLSVCGAPRPTGSAHPNCQKPTAGALFTMQQSNQCPPPQHNNHAHNAQTAERSEGLEGQSWASSKVRQITLTDAKSDKRKNTLASVHPHKLKQKGEQLVLNVADSLLPPVISEPLLTPLWQGGGGVGGGGQLSGDCHANPSASRHTQLWLGMSIRLRKPSKPSGSNFEGKFARIKNIRSTPKTEHGLCLHIHAKDCTCCLFLCFMPHIKKRHPGARFFGCKLGAPKNCNPNDFGCCKHEQRIIATRAIFFVAT